jgi:ABC-2 type transport system ATP-binding protein
MSTHHTIEVVNLTKSFGSIKVLKDISFAAKKGEILALLGPNGAGKTTTINILSTLLRPDGGTATVNGHDVIRSGDKVRASIGLTGQFAAVDEYLTGRENIKLIGQLYHMKYSTIDALVTSLLSKFDLVDAADRPAKTYSGGMKRRLDLAMSLVASPSILFLDEPTTGLDPRSRLALWKMIEQLAKDGTTILLTTQYMEEAEYLADDVIVIDHGTVIAKGTVNELKAQAGSEQVEITLKDPTDVANALKLIDGSVRAENDNNSIRLPAKLGANTLKNVLEQLESKKIAIDAAALRRPTLDDVFLALTGHDTSDTQDAEGAKK